MKTQIFYFLWQAVKRKKNRRRWFRLAWMDLRWRFERLYWWVRVVIAWIILIMMLPIIMILTCFYNPDDIAENYLALFGLSDGNDE